MHPLEDVSLSLLLAELAEPLGHPCCDLTLLQQHGELLPTHVGSRVSSGSSGCLLGCVRECWTPIER
ncbi:hypothetical protein GCM10027451_32750 [Geodermatophilus aquaeductus]